MRWQKEDEAKEDDAGNDSVFSVSTSVSRQTMRPADGHVENKANIFDEEEDEEGIRWWWKCCLGRTIEMNKS